MQVKNQNINLLIKSNLKHEHATKSLKVVAVNNFPNSYEYQEVIASVLYSTISLFFTYISKY